MKSLLIYIFLISIYSVLLFFGYRFGLNVLLFNSVFLVFIIVVLFKNKKVKNKYGLLFSIPILIISASYLQYCNLFQVFDVLALPLLFCMMLIYTIKPTYSITNLIGDICRVLFLPLECIGRFYSVVSNKLDELLKLNKNTKKKIISYVIIIPIVLIILCLLISADIEFKNIFSGFTNIFKDFSIWSSIGRIIMFIIVFTYLGAFINYLLFSYKKEETKDTTKFKVDAYTMKVLLIILNVIYVVFDIIQIKSLMLHHVGDGIVYSEYARSGFFQLMVISLINITILLLTKHCKEEKIHKAMSTLMVFLTLIIICSSFYRMYLYDMAYGYTYLRLLVYVTLITEAILLIPTMIYIFKNSFKILKYYMIIIVTVYSILNLVSFDRIIAYNNINRFGNSDKLDLDYLENWNYDNIPILYNYYKETNDKEMKEHLEDYFIVFKSSYKYENEQIFEYNYSRDMAYKCIDKIKIDEERDFNN